MIDTCNTPNNTCANTPTPTPTLTRTPTPTPTRTPTPTPTALPTFTVGIYASLQDIPTKIIPPGSGAETQARIYYTNLFPSPSFLLGGSITSTSCNFVGNITVPYGTTLNLGMLSYSYNNPIRFQYATFSTNCSAVVDAGCGIYTNGGGADIVVTSAMNIAMRAVVYEEYIYIKGGGSKSNGKTFDYCGNYGS